MAVVIKVMPLGGIYIHFVFCDVCAYDYANMIYDYAMYLE